MSVKIGLGMIVKDETEKLENILKNYGQFFDQIEITVTNESKKDELYEIVQKYGGNCTYFTWINDFAAARNFNKSLFTDCDYYFTLDCDDIVRNPSLIRSVAENAKQSGFSIVYGQYEYSEDAFGNVNALHWRERLIKIDDNLFWNKKIHENVLPKSTANYQISMSEDLTIKHNKSAQEYESSSERNLEYLIQEYLQDKEKTDPRTLAYLGRTFFNMGVFDKAIYFLEKHIEKSGWDEDRFYSWCVLAEVYRHKEEYQKAIACAFEALAERADYPDAYLKIHDIYQEQGKWDKAIEWGNMGLAKPMPKTFILVDPSSYTWRPALSLAFCYAQLGETEKAYKLFSYAKNLAPGAEYIKAQADNYEKAYLHTKYMEHFFWLLNFIKANDKNPKEKVRSLLDSVPGEVNKHEAIVQLKASITPPKTWAKNSIVILCGNVPEEWSPKSVETGIGGSEEAVIYQSRELTKLGYEVTVFNTCGENAGVYDGVTYRDIHEFNKNDEFNIFISWRMSVFHYGVKATKKIVWLHDVPQNVFKTKPESDCVDKILVLSEYHKSLLPEYAKEKAFVTTNGINLEDVSGIVRNPHKVIYASSYDRGLENLLEMWPDVKKAVPQAELHVFYGLGNYKKLVQDGLADPKFLEKINAQLKQDGVFDHGRVGHKELAKEFASSGVWAYPTEFPEISCITAMKAQAYGCIPVTTGFAALAETQKRGFKIPLSEFKDKLISVLNGECVALEDFDFSWESVAKEWDAFLFPSIFERTLIKDRNLWVRQQCEATDKIVDIGGNDGHTFNGWDRNNVTTVDLDLFDVPNFVRADANCLPFPDKQFDIAVLGEILEHVPDPLEVLKEAKRVGKKVVITVPEEHEWQPWQDPFGTGESKSKAKGMTKAELAKLESPTCLDFYKDDDYEHLWHQRQFDYAGLETLIQNAGFSNYEIKKLSLDDWVWYGAVLIS